MTYSEKFSWAGKELVVERDKPSVEGVSADGKQVKLEKVDVNDPSLQPSNYDKADGTILPIFKADGVRIDLSKRTKYPMTFWHRNMECDELIFCHQGEIRWETELGTITLGAGQMFVIPKGIAHRSLPPEKPKGDNIIIELKIRGDVSKLV